jgi:hypothetical protein
MKKIHIIHTVIIWIAGIFSIIGILRTAGVMPERTADFDVLPTEPVFDTSFVIGVAVLAATILAVLFIFFVDRISFPDNF